MVQDILLIQQNKKEENQGKDFQQTGTFSMSFKEEL